MNAMHLSRRRFLHFAAGATALPAVSRIARAQAYPSRPVRMLVGFPAGGTTDIAARLIAQLLTERLAQPVVVENRPGASANLAAEAVVRSPLVLEVNPSVATNSVPELIALAKANPGKITLASFGTGSTSHVAGELFICSKIVRPIASVPTPGGRPMITIIGRDG